MRAVIAAALLATFMQALNITLPNSAVPHIQGSLSMSLDEVGWIFTAYITAGLIVAPMTRWLAGRFGRKLVYQAVLAVFALGLALDICAETPLQFVLARIVQGAASGVLAPLCLAILHDIVPHERRARITLAWTVCLILGISSGASIGGWLSEYHGWRSIFYIGFPMTGLASLAMGLSLEEKKPARHPRFDFFGFATFALGLAGLQMMLDRGERLEWFASAEIWAEACASALGFYLYLVHVLTAEGHHFDKALFRDRNFILSTILYFAAGFVLLPTLALTSPMLEELYNYPVDTTGYMTIPRGVALVGGLVAMHFVPARFDSRLLVAAGVALVGYATGRMLSYSPGMDWLPVVEAGLIQGFGLGILMPALGRTAFSTLDAKHHPEGIALFNLSRFYGSTIGIAVVQIFFYDNTQAMVLALGQHLTPYHGAAALSAPHLALLSDRVTGQAAIVAVIDQFKILMLAILIASPLVLFLRGPRALESRK